MVTVFFLLMNGHCLPECSAVQLVNLVLKPHASLHRELRNLSLVNITAVPDLEGIVWDRVSIDVYGPTERLDLPYLFRISLNYIITSSTFSDDWVIETVNNLLADLEQSAAFSKDELFDGTSNFVDMFCYQNCGHHLLLKASVLCPVYNYTQWEHCPTPPRKLKHLHKSLLIFLVLTYQNQPLTTIGLHHTCKENMLINSMLIYSASFISQMSVFGSTSGETP